MFERSGYFVAADEDVIPADQENPAGFFENRRVLLANEAILDELHAAWFAPPSSAELRSLDPGLVANIEATLRTLLSQAEDRPVVLKDPRIAVLMPLWWPLLRGILHPVLAFRHPLEVAMSVERGLGASLPVGLAIWEIYFSTLLHHLAGEVVTVAPYEAILKHPPLASEIVGEASNGLETRLAASLDCRGAEHAVDGSLWRNRADPNQRASWLTERQASLWSWLAGLTPGTQCLHLETVPEPTEQAQRLIQYELRRQRELAQLRRAQQRVAEGESLRAELESRLRETAERAHHLETVLQRADQTISAIQGSRSWRFTKPLRSFRGRLSG